MIPVNERDRIESLKKAKYFEEVKKAEEAGCPYGMYTPGMLWALRDMAQNDIWPDWRFGDTDCNVWSMFHAK